MRFRSLIALVAIFTTLAFKPKFKEEVFKVDTNSSSIKWVAGKVAGQHEGLVKLESGSLTMDGNNLKNGNFVINMRTISVTDLKGNANANLLNHLKGDDFFSVEKNPSSSFQITRISNIGAERVNVTGNLSIKGITNSITFPATVKRQKNTVVAVAKGVKVDRTKYDIKYRSKSFFGDIGDKAINDEFELDINLVAKK
ncbi:YceI family protein [Pedobacter sp. SYSU D00535]|uniref:YceI family protein n=1 Tax=Pedobacter sp. SYSU D00535 TaxID=2810308 RepID=UPI001A977C8E|nr:YceI family protein [Pedobacter sp. SYSU D00535]